MVSVSVIMPVYNEQSHLERALKSWINQTLVNKELICIDDGSTDDSRAIIEEYCEQYPNIRLFSQNRLGAGAARNLGIENAEGEFVCFLDADDFYLDCQGLDSLYYAAVNENADISAGLLQLFTHRESKKDPVIRELLKNGKITKIQYEDFQFDYQYQCFMFKREYLNRYNIRFPLYKRFQDPPFFVQALYFAKEFLVVPVEFYGYQLGSKVIRYTAEKTYDLFQGLLFDLRFADQYGLKKLLKLTIHRINWEYFGVLYEGLNSETKPLLRLILEAELIASKYNCVIEPLEAVFYVKKMADPLPHDKYLCTLKIRNLIPANSRVVLYGAGNIGMQCYRIMSNNSNYEITGWIDQYKARQLCLGEELAELSKIREWEYDYVLIAIDNVKIAEEVKNQLTNQGVNKECLIRWNEMDY